jgi:hypothetical protein
MRDCSRPLPGERSRWVVGRLFVGLANPSLMHAMRVLVKESWWSSNQADLPGPYHLFWMQDGQRALHVAEMLFRGCTTPRDSTGNRAGQQLVLPELWRCPELHGNNCGYTVANERPAALEKVQLNEETHLHSYNGYGV